MKFSKLIASAFAALFLVIPLSVTAEEITVSFEAIVDWDNSHSDVTECLGLESGVNDTITGLFIYSTLDEHGSPVPDTDPDPDEFFTMFSTAPNSMVVEVGDYWFRNDPDDFRISLAYYDRVFNEGADLYSFTSGWTGLTNSDCGGLASMRMYITDTNGDAITTVWPVKIPTTVPVLKDWVGPTYFSLALDSDLIGTITSIERVYLVDDIMEALATLLENNPLDARQETGLYQKAASAIAKFDKDRAYQGCQQLSAFICQLEALLPMFEQTDDFGLANAILGTAYEIFEEECSAPNLHVMECPMGD